MKPVNKLSVPEQAILYATFEPLDTVAKKLFEISDAELFIVKQLAAEKFSPKTISINPNLYQSEFEQASKDHQAPRTATKIRRPRGRPGLNIIKAFSSIPLCEENSVDATQFAKEHGITVSSLRQFTRFDKTGMDGKVEVKMDKLTRNLMVWRDTGGNTKNES